MRLKSKTIKKTLLVAFPNRLILLLAIISMSILEGCSVYSFTGGSVGLAKTISVINFINETGGPASLAQTLSENLRAYYQTNTKLFLVKKDPDWQLEGKIIGYTVSPQAPQAGQTAGLNRLTIRVNAKFTNNIDTKSSFQSEFSYYQDFPQAQSLSDVESSLDATILENIVLQIFTKTTSNW